MSEFYAIVDGQKIKGILQEKEKAKAAYDDAISSGKSAFTLEKGSSSQTNEKWKSDISM